MSQNYTATDGLMYVGDTPWHGLGVELGQVATAAEAIAAANLDWEVIRRDIFTYQQRPEGAKLSAGAKPAGEHMMVPVPGKKAYVRQDTKEVLAIMSDRYQPVQNTDAFGCMDAAVGAGAAIYHTAGSLAGGRKVFILAKLPGDLVVSDRDLLEKYILLSNAHDGSAALTIHIIPLRKWCKNMLGVRLSGGAFRARHTTNILTRVGEIQDLLGTTEAYFELFLRGAEQLAATTMTSADALRVFGQTYELDPNKAIEEQSPFGRDALNNTMTLWRHGRGNVGATAWDAVNAVVEYVDHMRPVGNVATSGQKSDVAVVDKRLQQSWFGQGAAAKQRVWDLLVGGMI